MEPEIIPPETRPQRPRAERGQGDERAAGRLARDVRDEQLDQLASLLDECFQIPGTRIRFGLDSLVGLLPGLGDVIAGLASSFIILTAHQRGVPRVTIGRMVANVMIDTLFGAIPVAGDIFDVAWKANRRNVDLLKRHADEGVSRKQTWLDALFLAGALLAVLASVTVPLLIIWWLATKIFGA